ncbi:MAG: hypothetical protein JXR58_12440 [Bacteroidales bacterium]|nr:hypothetical protein [Bacteroidales bacterium]
MRKQSKNTGIYFVLFAIVLQFVSCGKEKYRGQNYFVLKWKITEVVESGMSDPTLVSPGFIEFREDGTGQFYFEFETDTLNTEFVYVIEYFASPWPQDKQPELSGEDNGPNRIILYNMQMGEYCFGENGSINISIEYIKKKKKITFLYDELFNSNTPFDNLDGTKSYFICEPFY